MRFAKDFSFGIALSLSNSLIALSIELFSKNDSMYTASRLASGTRKLPELSALCPYILSTSLLLIATNEKRLSSGLA